MSELFLNSVISKVKRECKEAGFSATVSPELLYINEPLKVFDLHSAYFILNTKKLPLYQETLLMLRSPDNFFHAVKSEYDNLSAYKYQLFTQYLEVKVNNHSPINRQPIIDNEFVPFYLEFVKIIPFKKKENEQ